MTLANYLYHSMEPPVGIEPTSQDYKSSASPRMLWRQTINVYTLPDALPIPLHYVRRYIQP